MRSILEVHTIAFGLSRSFNVPAVTSALTNMCVEMRLVSDAKHEETDRQLERAARELAGDPAVEAIVILSSDKDFNGLVRDLRRQANKRVYVVHDAPRGSPHEELLSLYATGTYHIDDFVSSPQRSNFGRDWHRSSRCTAELCCESDIKTANLGPGPQLLPWVAPQSQACGSGTALGLALRWPLALLTLTTWSTSKQMQLAEPFVTLTTWTSNQLQLAEMFAVAHPRVHGMLHPTSSLRCALPHPVNALHRLPSEGTQVLRLGRKVPLSRDAAIASRTLSPRRAAEILRLREIFL